MSDHRPGGPEQRDPYAHLFTSVEALIPGIGPRSSSPDHEPIGETRPGNIFRLVFDALHKKYDRETQARLKEFILPLRGQVVVDIGSGNSIYGYKIAEAAGASAYIGIDPVKHYVDDLRRQLITWRYGQKNLLPVAFEQQGAESFLSRLPDASVSFLAGDIDGSILESPEHQKSVSSEVARTLHPNGMFLSWNSVIDLPRDTFSRELFADADRSFSDFRLSRYQKK